MYFKNYLLALVCGLAGLPLIVNASHIYGADFYYQHGTGNNYTLTLVVYGDCSGTPVYNSLSTSTPQINVFDDATAQNFLYQTINLNLTAPGVEVTPVCPSQLANTACNGGALPGVGRFIYSGTVTLPYTSTGWRFRFTGAMGNSSAGRSASITNIANNNGSSLMNMEAQLNNGTGPNSSPQFTTLPTPFYCINVPQQYNQGAVDPDGDSLVYSLAPALDGNGPISYVTGYSATNPLATNGNFTFSTSTGQMSFTPNLTQRSVVVNKVTEYRNGVIVGTAMREMSFIVANTCSGNPPTGLIDTTISASSGGIASLSANQFLVCYGTGATAQFNIHPTDPEGDTINVTTNGLPAGSVINIVGNNTTAPVITFTWNTMGVAAGNYTFYITYKDFGCPLSHQQTIAYTVSIVKQPEVAVTMVTPTQCVHKAGVRYNLNYGVTPRKLVISQGSNILKTFTDTSGIIMDSLYAGTYTFTVSSYRLTCVSQYTVNIVDSGTYPFRPVTASPVGYCLNDAATPLAATAAAGANLRWYNANDNYLPAAPTPITTTAGLTTFYVSQKVNVCESLKDTVQVYVTQRPVASIASPTSICTKDTTTISFNGAVGVGPIIAYNWTWNGANYVNGTGGGPYSVQWDTAGVKTITLQVFENLCPSLPVSVQLTVKPTPKSIFTLPPTACVYDTIRVQYNTSPLTGQQYAWGFDGATIVQGSDGGPYALHWLTEGTKHITLEVSLDGCTDTSSDNIILYPSPVAHIVNTPTGVCIADKIYLVATGGINYTWTPDDRIYYEPDGVLFTWIMEPTTYVVTVKNEYGCTSKDSISYTQIEPCCTFAYPDAFTPNNDGHNDTYHVVTYGNQQAFELSIYNRWGQQIFDTFDPKASWDGTANGKPCPTGTYFYYLKARCYTGHNEEHKGDFQLLR